VRVGSANLEMAGNATTALAAKAKASTARRMAIMSGPLRFRVIAG
jgi:hypothetical protein